MSTIRLNAGGAIAPGELYVERDLDREISQALENGELCYVLGPRQVGKSSLFNKLKNAFANKAGYRGAGLSLLSIGSSDDEATVFYDFASVLADQLGLTSPWQSQWREATVSPVERWKNFLVESALVERQERLVILIDEIDQLILQPFIFNNFFHTINELYHNRAENAELKRLIFCFFGSYLPDPEKGSAAQKLFDTARQFWMNDFSEAEMQAFLPALPADFPHREKVLSECHRWTGGHPYLTQKVLNDLIAKSRFPAARIQHEVQKTIDQLFFEGEQSGDEIVAEAGQRCLLNEPGAAAFDKLNLYKLILEHGTLQANQTPKVELALRLAGLATHISEEGHTYLCPRNEIIAKYYDSEWANARLSQLLEQKGSIDLSQSAPAQDDALEKMKQKVTEIFCEPEGNVEKPYEKVEESAALLPGILYRFILRHRKTRERLALQLYDGIKGISGELWENEMRALNSTISREHPAFPQLREGDFIEDKDLAYIVSSAALYTLDEPGVIDRLRKENLVALRNLTVLAEGLELLHGNGLVHRNLNPESIEVIEDHDTKELNLRLSRFEMSSLIANLLRRVDPQAKTDDADPFHDKLNKAVELYRQQKPSILACASPERLNFIFRVRGKDMFEGIRSDVFSLGVVAYQLFVGPLPEKLVDKVFVSHEYNESKYHELVDEMIGNINGAALPKPLREIIKKMLDWDWRTRYTATEVKNRLYSEYEDISGYWSDEEKDQSYLLTFLPKEAAAFMYDRDFIKHRADTGLEEVIEFLEEDLRHALLTYSSSGFAGIQFNSNAKQEEAKAAKYVLLGQKIAYYCSPFRPKSPAQLQEGPETRRTLMYRFCEERERAWRVEWFNPIKRKLPSLELVPLDSLPKENAITNPSWHELLKSVERETTMGWQGELEKASDWFLQLSKVRLDARLYPVTIEFIAAENVSECLCRVEMDEARDDEWTHKSNFMALYTKDPRRRPPLGDFFADETETAGARIYLRRDRNGKPYMESIIEDEFDDTENIIKGVFDKRDGAESIIAKFAAPRERILPIKIGWLQLADDEGTRLQIKRQARARLRLMEMPGLIDQLGSPRSSVRLPFYAKGAAEGLQGNASKVIKNMLNSWPFYALLGPPGTGKTTVAAHAVLSVLERDRNLHALISAQSHLALDNLAERILDQLQKKNPAAAKEYVFVRLASAMGKERVSSRMQDYLPEKVANDCINRIKETKDNRYADNPNLSTILEKWRQEVSNSALEIRNLLMRGANCIFCTTGTATVDYLGATGDDRFDWVIVEEAAKAWPTELIMPLTFGQKWTLIGDPKQLPAFGVEEIKKILQDCAASPYEDLREHGKNYNNYIRVFEMFEHLFDAMSSEDDGKKLIFSSPKPPVEQLTYQFRMAEPIADIVSRAFYEKKLLTPESLKNRPFPLTAPDSLVDKHLIWLDTEKVAHAQEARWWKNAGEVSIVTNVTEKILNNFKTNKKTKEKFLSEQLAILSPYKAQLYELRNALIKVDSRLNDCLQTVDSFQGREADVAIISLVRNNDEKEPKARLGFLSDPKRVNVLFSRARFLLILVGKFNHFSNSGVDFWQEICEAFNTPDRRIDASSSEWSNR